MIYISFFKSRGEEKKKKTQTSLNSKYVTSNTFSLSFILTLQSSLSKPKVLKGKYWEGLVKKKTLAEMRWKTDFPG